MKYKRSPSIVSRSIAGEFILVPVHGDLADLRQLFSLNATGQSVWMALAEPATEEELASAIVREYDVDESQARRDIGELLGQLLERKMIEIVA